MAKWGEGDERWKVEELGVQGRNVNNWHWEETNALPWSKDRLTELLGGAAVVDNVNGTTVRLDKTITLTGDAIINQRKGKLIPAYELDFNVKWTGTDGDGTDAGGEIKIPYISEENHDEDPEVQITTTSGGAAGEKMRTLIVQHGRPIIYKAVAVFVKELWAGGPVTKRSGSPHGNGGDAATGITITTAATGNGSAATANAAAELAAATAATTIADKQTSATTATASKSSGGTVTITENFFCSPRDLFECFTDAGRMRAYTGSAAEVEPRPGGKFSMFGGSVEGAIRELDPPSKLELDWRFNSWPDGAMSVVSLEFTEKERGATTLIMKQVGIPDMDRYGNHDCLGMTQAGWKQQVLLRIRQVFGYGA